MKRAIRVRLNLRKQMLLRDTERCVFCGQKPTTKEHIYPKRWHKHLLRRSTTQNSVRIDIRYRDRIEGAIFKIPPLRDWQPKAVCGACNNGWMRELEERLDPLMSRLINGRKASLSNTDVGDLAMWAIMKVMVVHHRVTRASQRREMRKKEKAPCDGWGMWIATYKRKAWKTEFISTPFRVDPDFQFESGQLPRGWPANSIATTQIIKKLLVHTVYCPHSRLAQDWRYTPPRIAGLGGNLIKIWPPTGVGIRKWPQATLSDADAVLTAFGLLATLMRWAANAGLAPPLTWK